MTIDEQIANLKAKLERAQRDNIRAEANKESAQATYDLAIQQLQKDFGVDNLGQARAKLEELEGALTKKLAEVTELLDNIEV